MLNAGLLLATFRKKMTRMQFLWYADGFCYYKYMKINASAKIFQKYFQSAKENMLILLWDNRDIKIIDQILCNIYNYSAIAL